MSHKFAIRSNYEQSERVLRFLIHENANWRDITMASPTIHDDTRVAYSIAMQETSCVISFLALEECRCDSSLFLAYL